MVGGVEIEAYARVYAGRQYYAKRSCETILSVSCLGKNSTLDNFPDAEAWCQNLSTEVFW